MAAKMSDAECKKRDERARHLADARADIEYQMRFAHKLVQKMDSIRDGQSVDATMLTAMLALTTAREALARIKALELVVTGDV